MADSAAFSTVTPLLADGAYVGWLRWLVLVPLFGAAWNGLLGRFAERHGGRRFVHVVALGCAALTFFVACFGLSQLLDRPIADRYLLDRVAPWFGTGVAGRLRSELFFALDPLSCTWTLVISGFGGLVHLYAVGYMSGERKDARFFACLNLFLAAMLLLVLGDNFLSLFMGWEGVGLASYLLIGYWFEVPRNASAATKAFVVNRIGDLGLLVAMAALFWSLGGGFVNGHYRNDGASGTKVRALPVGGEKSAVVFIGPTLRFREIVAQLELRDRGGRRPVMQALSRRAIFGIPALWIVAIGLFLAAAGKSAQLPLSIWLPDAMAGPTPVSALIHAATLVTAGVYLLARFSSVIAAVPQIALGIAVLGLCTALFGALAATAQTDLKRVLAYSTISQLGLMFVGIGVGAPQASVFHVVTHACFKALLFLAAGAVIHAVHHALTPVDTGFLVGGATAEGRAVAHPENSLHNMGGLAPLLPHTRWAYLVGCLGLSGIPVAAGFYSKDALFAAALVGPWGGALFAGAMLVAALTAYYAFRSYYLVFFGRPANAGLVAHAAEPPRSMAWVLWIFAGLCLVLGPVLGAPHLLTGEQPVLEHFIASTLRMADEPGRAAELVTLVGSLTISLLGWWFARARFYRGAVDAGAPVLVNAFSLDAFYAATLVRGLRALARALAYLDEHLVDGLVRGVAFLVHALTIAAAEVDRVVVDGAVDGVARLCALVGGRLRQLQSGQLNHYILGLVVGAFALMVAATLW